jgi:hypothetical protein
MADVQGGLQSAAPRNCATQPGAAILRSWNGLSAGLLGAAGCGQPCRGATCHRPGAGLCELALLRRLLTLVQFPPRATDSFLPPWKGCPRWSHRRPLRQRAGCRRQVKTDPGAPCRPGVRLRSPLTAARAHARGASVQVGRSWRPSGSQRFRLFAMRVLQAPCRCSLARAGEGKDAWRARQAATYPSKSTWAPAAASTSILSTKARGILRIFCTRNDLHQARTQDLCDRP